VTKTCNVGRRAGCDSGAEAGLNLKLAAGLTYFLCSEGTSKASSFWQ